MSEPDKVSRGFWRVFVKGSLAFAVALAPLLAMGHVGSPNVFFEGLAGIYSVRVSIRPPAVLPGSAQVDVRVATSGVTSVLLQARVFDGGGAAPPPTVQAAPVRGETNLFNGVLWFLGNGSYSVDVTVEGAGGTGRVSVPLNSAATQMPAMKPLLQWSLTGLGLLLGLAAVLFAGAAARDCGLDPGQEPRPRDSGRGRLVTVAVAVILAGGIYGGKLRWRAMDAEFRNNALYQPVPVISTIRTNGSLQVLHLEPLDEANPLAQSWEALAADHGKLMHLFLLRESDANVFAHLHPVRRDSRTFESVLPPLPAGRYALYAEITYENGLNQTLLTNIALGGLSGAVPQMPTSSNMLNDVYCQSGFVPVANGAEPLAMDADDSWHVGGAGTVPRAARGSFCRLMNGSSMVYENSSDLRENQETSLHFAVFAPDGKPAPLQPYMGMLGHAVVRRTDGQVFTHLHPLGTISMAAQSILARQDSGLPSTTTNLFQQTASASEPGIINEVTFPYAFPRPGEYRLWVQVRISARVITGVFDVTVNAPR